MPFKTPANNTVIQPVFPAMSPKIGSMDNSGRLRMSAHQNIYEADFEYGAQPMRWENFIISSVAGASTINQLPGSGGVRMRISGASGDMTVRQTRPYHRYQPGKSLVLSTAVNFGTARTNHRQRCGFFDDGNGMFIEQADPVFTTTNSVFTGDTIAGLPIITGLSTTAVSAAYVGMPVSGIGIISPTTPIKDPNGTLASPYTTTITGIINSTAVSISSTALVTQTGGSFTFTTQANPFGMFCVVRSDVNIASSSGLGTNNGLVTDQRIPLPCWNGDQATINSLDWTRIQMLWMEYTWYGAGMARWGCVINGEWIVLHYITFANRGPINITNPQGTAVVPSQIGPWARTGNLPVRYEQRNIGVTSNPNDMFHWGVSVTVEGGQDDQRGFTYSYGMNPTIGRRQVGSGSTRFPVLSVAPRPMAVIEISGNSTFNAPTAASNNAAITIASNTTFDGVIASSQTVSYTNLNNVITVAGGGSTANIFPGQLMTSSVSGIPAGATVTFVNSTAYTISAAATVSQASATGNTITNNTLVGRHIYFPAQGAANTGLTGRVTSSNSTVIRFTTITSTPGVSTPIANTLSMTGTPFQIGLINRGQLLPKKMYISTDAQCTVELITSAPGNPVLLTGANFATLANTRTTTSFASSSALTQADGLIFSNNATVNTIGLGSNYSFSMRDVVATSMTGGEVVFALTSPNGGPGLQEIDLSYFFPLYNTIAGNLPDILTVAVTTTSGASANVAVHLVCQEAMA